MRDNTELYGLKDELQLNASQLNDVARAKAELDKEWTALQLVRTGIVRQIIELEQPRNFDA